MGFFDRLFRGKDRHFTDPEQLRAALFEAVSKQDLYGLGRLCRSHQDMIFTHFGTWKKVPDAVRTDPARMQSYAHGLIGLAQFFAERLGRPELIAALTGTPESIPSSGGRSPSIGLRRPNWTTCATIKRGPSWPIC